MSILNLRQFHKNPIFFQYSFSFDSNVKFFGTLMTHINVMNYCTSYFTTSLSIFNYLQTLFENFPFSYRKIT